MQTHTHTQTHTTHTHAYTHMTHTNNNQPYLDLLLTLALFCNRTNNECDFNFTELGYSDMLHKYRAT